jgi:hypothetical protein
MDNAFNPQNNGAGHIVNAPMGAYRPIPTDLPDEEPIYVAPVAREPSFFQNPYIRAAIFGGSATGVATLGGMAPAAVALGLGAAAVNEGLLRLSNVYQEREERRERREGEADTDVDESSDDEPGDMV